MTLLAHALFYISSFLKPQEVCVKERERERQRALWRTASVLSDMGQGGDVEAYLPHQATHATGKCTCLLFERTERRIVESFVWDVIKGTGNTISPVLPALFSCGWERKKVCVCLSAASFALEIFLFYRCVFFLVNKIFFSLWAHPSFVSCFSMTFLFDQTSGLKISATGSVWFTMQKPAAWSFMGCLVLREILGVKSCVVSL